jgi:hypothetical protein
MWSGLLKPDEWARLQTPGKVLSKDVAFWERAVDDVLEQYLGYNLSQQVPEVREELVRYALKYNGDIRAVHYAVATSIAYLQSNGGTTPKKYRWTYGPLKQLDAEVWVDSMASLAGYPVGACDHRISDPESFLEAGSLSAYRLLASSRWKIDEEGEVDTRYSELARTLGGCPENVVGGRFKVVSILTTATQLSFVNELCNPGFNVRKPGAPAESLLPGGVGGTRVLTAELAGQIADHQYKNLLGRSPSAEELTEAKGAGEQCALGRCTAEEYARPLCFALLSSAEMIFY